ncbi:putative quinol monooxygenase [Deinococcus sp. UYEF24]
MIYELRHYQTEPGQRDAWVQLMETQIIPFQTEQGMQVVGSFVDEGNPDVYIWIRRFESEEQLKAQYAAVYGSDRWKNEIGPAADPLLKSENITVTRLLPTPASSLQ